jgi:hypothetical protein
MVRITTKERGWAGHFIGAANCAYRRNTLVSDGKEHIIVSSVGAYRAMGRDIDKIGCNRFYETMVFRGVKEGPYIDIDVQEQIPLPDDLEWGIFGEKVEDLPRDSDNKMDDIHEKVVSWVVKRFKSLSRPSKRQEAKG